MYFLGIGRGEKMPQRRKSHGQANMPLPTPTSGAGQVAEKVEAAERSPVKKRK